MGLVSNIRPEKMWSNQEQGYRPEQLYVAEYSDDLWLGVKC